MVRRVPTRLDKAISHGAAVLVAGQVPPLLAAVVCGCAIALVAVFGLVAALARSRVRRNAAYDVMSLLLRRSTGADPRQARKPR
jgi:hypothetical protein